MTLAREELDDLDQPVLRLYGRNRSEPDDPQDPEPTGGSDDDSESRERRSNVEAYWAGRNRADRHSARVAA